MMANMSSHFLVFAILVSAWNLSALKLTLIHGTIDSRKPPSNVSLHDIRGDLIPSKSGHLVFAKISVGDPPSPQLLAMDTCSSQTWIQCDGCTACFQQRGPLFNPAGSRTYERVSCHTVSCPGDCDVVEDACRYTAEYADGTVSQGFLGTEEFTFSTSDEGKISFGGIVFGCCYKTAGPPDILDGGTGLLGLGWGSNGLVSQLKADRFSYCVGDITDKKYVYSHLIVGGGSRLEGPSTPLTMFGDNYHVILEGVSIGDKRFDTVVRGWREYLMVDSGSTWTYLPNQASDPIWDEVKKFVGSRLNRRRPLGGGRDDKLCYWGVSRKEMVGFPVVRLHLAGGVDLVLGIESLFGMYSRSYFSAETSFCLTIAPITNGNGLSIIGLMAQQFYNVGYNLNNSRMYFEKTDCESLDD